MSESFAFAVPHFRWDLIKRGGLEDRWKAYTRDGSSVMSRRANGALGSSLREQEHTVVNVGGPDGPPRLVWSLFWVSSYQSMSSSSLDFYYNHFYP